MAAVANFTAISNADLPRDSLLSWQETLDFVKKSISHAMARDGSSGGIIRTCVVTEDGVEREYIPGNKLPYGP